MLLRLLLSNISILQSCVQSRPHILLFQSIQGLSAGVILEAGKASRRIHRRDQSVCGPAQLQSSPSICLGVATIARTKEQYIRRAIGSLLEGLTNDQRGSIHSAVFAQTDRSQHPIYNEPWLKYVANEILQYDVSNK